MKTLIKLACQASLIALVSANMSSTASAKLETLLQSETKLNGQSQTANNGIENSQGQLNSKKPEDPQLNSLRASGAALEGKAKNGGRRLDNDSAESVSAVSADAPELALSPEVESGDGKPALRGPANFKGKKANDKGFKAFMQSWLATEEEVVAVTLDEEAVLEEAPVEEVAPVEEEEIPTNVNRRLQEKEIKLKEVKAAKEVKAPKIQELKEDKPESIKDDDSVQSVGSQDSAAEAGIVEVTAVEPTTEIIVEGPVVEVIVEEPIVEVDAPEVNRRLNQTKTQTPNLNNTGTNSRINKEDGETKLSGENLKSNNTNNTNKLQKTEKEAEQKVSKLKGAKAINTLKAKNLDKPIDNVVTDEDDE